MPITFADDAVLEAWLRMMYADAAPDDLDDLARQDVVTPDPSMLRGFIVKHFADQKPPIGVPAPTFYMPDPDRPDVAWSTWFFKVPIAPVEGTKPFNAYRMTGSMLAAAMHGLLSPTHPSPFPAPEQMLATAPTTMAVLKTALQKAGFGKDRFDWLARQHGGQQMTEAQTAARRASIAKAREVARQRKAEQADARALEVVAIADSTTNTTEVAERLEVAVTSVGKTVRRARERVADLEPAATSAPPAADVVALDLDDLLADIDRGPEPPRPRTLWEARQRRKAA